MFSFARIDWKISFQLCLTVNDSGNQRSDRKEEMLLPEG